MGFEYSFGGKYLELLKDITPNMTRVTVLRGADSPGGLAVFASIQGVAPLLRLEVTPINVRDAGEIERAVGAFARSPNGGMVVISVPGTMMHRDLIIALAARHRLPAIYPERYFAALPVVVGQRRRHRARTPRSVP
jgi:putative ABC transport system substrate-binding protein